VKLAERLGLVFVVASCALATPALAVERDDEGATETAEPKPPTPRELKDVEILDKLGDKVPMDVELIDETGAKVKLGKYFSGERAGKPVLLTLGYYECPMLCSLVLNGTLDALKATDLEPGKDFTWVTVSFDPKENTDTARMKRERYVEAYGREGAEAGWHFHTGDPAQVRRLADAVGFRYRWDEKSEQWAHGAGIFFLGADGTLTRTLFGLTFKPKDVKFALMEASNGTVGTITERILLSCFSYTPDKQRYGVYVFGVMRLAGVLTVLLLGGFLIILWRRERRSR
jgi:protein SCO1/2